MPTLLAEALFAYYMIRRVPRQHFHEKWYAPLMDKPTAIVQARADLAKGRRRHAARLLLGAGGEQAAALLDQLPPDGPHGTALIERLRFGPPETWAGWLAGHGRVAVKLWPQRVPPLPSFAHAGVAPLIACGPTWRVTAWVEGVTLTKARLTPDQAIAVLCDMEEAVEALHAAGLTHGDLNAANVVVTPEGRAVLIDWGEPGVGGCDRHALARLTAELLGGGT
jgi:hypothetical protein